MKIIITSVGRRVELVDAFKNAAARLGAELEIFGADISDTAPALKFCDYSVKVPKITEPEYIPALKKICAENDIDALIPTIDTDLLILSKCKDEFGKTKVIISDTKKIEICRDKRKTEAYFRDLGLDCPHTVDDADSYKFGFPAFIKPKDGSSSKSAYKVKNKEELDVYAKKVPGYVVQNFIEGTEYTVDVCCDFDGNPILITPRIRLAVRSGEVLKTKICQDDGIISEIKKIIADFKPCGQITVQLIKEKNTGKNFYIEINPRFGGGAPLSMYAGADSAEVIIRLLQGEKLSYMPKKAEDGAIYSRFDQAVRIN